MVYEYFQSPKNKNWYWHLKADNGKKIADGAEGYVTKDACLAGIKLVKSSSNAQEKEVKAA